MRQNFWLWSVVLRQFYEASTLSLAQVELVLLNYKKLTKHFKTHYLPTTAYSKTATQITYNIQTCKQIIDIKYK